MEKFSDLIDRTIKSTNMVARLRSMMGIGTPGLIVCGLNIELGKVLYTSFMRFGEDEMREIDEWEIEKACVSCNESKQERSL